MIQKNEGVKARKSASFLPFFLSFFLFTTLLGCGKENRVIIEAPPTVYYGFVTDSGTTTPVAGAELLVDSLFIVATTDATGYYRFPRLGASLWLFCRATSYQTQSKTVGSRPADSLQVEFKLVP